MKHPNKGIALHIAVSALVAAAGLVSAPAFSACSPIVIDLRRDGIKFGPKGVAVDFDVNADGVLDHVQWVRPRGDEAFLAIDIDGSGKIEDGSELFGEGTTIVMEGRTAPNGFVALAQFDSIALGGNDDGLITKEDSVWGNLRIWTDSNADGISAVSEVKTPDDFALTAFETIPRLRRYEDEAGNTIPFVAAATFGPLRRKTLMVDVFFAQVPRDP